MATRYDDGGLSGGTMDRPALQDLLVDIERKKVDLVVVYKVDRLTRSLTDFTKLVEIFDAHDISFVSVTQQFNTTTSMGRLTLNMLLSFAQFEREVTGERIRDKIAASKRKGMWMGGLVPLGYDAVDKKLIVNRDEAETVKKLFCLYLALGTVRNLYQETNRLGLITKRRRNSCNREMGGRPFSRGHLHQLLANRIYVGEITHKGVAYPGQHAAIIDRSTFDAVQDQLAENAAQRFSTTNLKAPSLLTGLVYDKTGDRLCPTHANKVGRRYRYYISKRLMHAADSSDGGWRLPAKELEQVTNQVLCEFLTDEVRIIDALQEIKINPDRLGAILRRAEDTAAELQSKKIELQRQLLRSIIHRVVLSDDSLRMEINRSGLSNLLLENRSDAVTRPPDPYTFSVPVKLRRRGVESKLVVRGTHHETPVPDAKLINLLARAHRWLELLTEGKAASVKEIANSEDINASDIGRTIQLAFLAPDIVEAILAGLQPIELTPRCLMRIGAMPLAWDRQRQLLGFPQPL